MNRLFVRIFFWFIVTQTVALAVFVGLLMALNEDRNFFGGGRARGARIWPKAHRRLTRNRARRGCAGSANASDANSSCKSVCSKSGSRILPPGLPGWMISRLGLESVTSNLLNACYFWVLCIVFSSMKLRIGQAAKELGVAIETLRRWEAAGKIEAERTANGHRRYDIAKLRGLTPRRDQSSLKLTIGYARVSSHDQKEDLIRQVALLESYCAAKGWNYEVIQDLGSGLNYNKRGLRHLIKRICNSEIERLVVNHKDRLLRFGSELIFSLCEHFGVEVVVINAGSEVSFEEELTQDVLEIITVFSARLYGSRSHKNKKIVESLKEIGDRLISDDANSESGKRGVESRQVRET